MTTVQWRQKLWDERLKDKQGRPLEELNISAQVLRFLRNAEIDTIEELCQHSVKKLRQTVKNLGPNRIAEIQTALESVGLRLQPSIRTLHSKTGIKIHERIDAEYDGRQQKVRESLAKKA